MWKGLSTAALCAATGLAVHLGSDGSAQCDAAPPAAAAAARSEAQLAELKAWLRQQGADVDAIEFRESATVRVGSSQEG